MHKRGRKEDRKRERKGHRDDRLNAMRFISYARAITRSLYHEHTVIDP